MTFRPAPACRSSEYLDGARASSLDAKNNEDLREVEEGEEEFSIEESGRRADTLAEALAEIRLPCTLENAALVLDIPTVLNNLTCQQMVYCPRTGDVKVWRRDTR